MTLNWQLAIAVSAHYVYKSLMSVTLLISVKTQSLSRISSSLIRTQPW